MTLLESVRGAHASRVLRWASRPTHPDPERLGEAPSQARETRVLPGPSTKIKPKEASAHWTRSE